MKRAFSLITPAPSPTPALPPTAPGARLAAVALVPLFRVAAVREVAFRDPPFCDLLFCDVAFCDVAFRWLSGWPTLR